MRIADKLYGELVFKNRSVAYEYRRYKESHYQLHRRFRLLSWAYLLWLLCKYRLLRQDKRLRLRYPESEAAIYPQMEELLRKCEGAEVVSLNVFDTLLLRKVTAQGSCTTPWVTFWASTTTANSAGVRQKKRRGERAGPRALPTSARSSRNGAA